VRQLHRETTGILLGALLLILLAGCSHIYRKQYVLPDDSTPEIAYEGYTIKLGLQSRLAGYMGSENLFYLYIETSYPGDYDSSIIATPTELIRFDSVCIQPMSTTDLTCLNLIDKYEVLDNYYQRAAYLTRHQFDGLTLGKREVFVTVSYVVEVLDPQTLTTAHRKRFQHELRRKAHRTQ